jgi:hypothetical protein
MSEDLTTIQTDVATREKLRVIAKVERRSMTGELATLVDKEFARLFSQPNPEITVGEAEAASVSVETATGKGC